MEQREEIARYRQAAAFLPVRLRRLAETLPPEEQAEAEELLVLLEEMTMVQAVLVLVPELEDVVQIVAAVHQV